MLPKLVRVPVAKLDIKILTVKVAVPVIPTDEATQPPVNVTPPASGTALYPFVPDVLPNVKPVPVGKPNLTLGHALTPPTGVGTLLTVNV